MTTKSGPITYTSGPFAVSNASGELVDEGEATTPTCSPAQTFPCDNFALTVTVPSGYSAANPGSAVRIAMSFATATGSNPGGAEEFDLYVYNSAGTLIAQSIANDPAIINVPVADGTATYTVQIVPTQAAGDSASTTISLTPGVVATAPPTGNSSTPRYQLYDPTSQNQGSSSSGEFSIGYDLKTGVIMTMNNVGQVYAVTPPELVTDPENPAVKLPEACQAVWSNVSNNTGDETQVTTLDPILWTDQASGRTFQSNSTAGAEATFTFTDDDGQSWTSASAAPPNGGVDHETVATGPYPAGSPFSSVAAAAGINYATYYCSQAEVPDYCQRSDSGGSSFGPGVPITNGVTNTCSGIHGHVKVSPYDGSVWVPIRSCGAKSGGSVSLDAGTTWNQFSATNSTANTSNFDPSIALSADGTAYFCYVGSDNHPHVTVSPGAGTAGGAASDGGTWINDVDIGAQQNVQSAVFVQAVAGDANRASCGFIGTTTPGAWSANTFTGVWYLYIATTYDGGKTWSTVNADPNNIVQAAGGICNQGTVCPSNPDTRNLLDFNEVTMDKFGHVLYGFDQGCVSAACQGTPTFANNDFVANSRVMRQAGGMSLLAKYDNQPNFAGTWAPKPPCLSGTRAPNATNLSWIPGDNGGQAITAYKVYRSQTMGGEQTGSPLATIQPTSGTPKTTYTDTTVNSLPSGPVYYTVIGVNSTGQSVFSNEVEFGTATTGGGNFCVAPGVTIASSSTGSTDANATATPYYDITGLSVAEPYPGSAPFPTAKAPSSSITFTIDVSGTSPYTSATPPQNGVWVVSWNQNDTAGVSHNLFVQFDTETPATTGEFSYGFNDATTTGTTTTVVACGGGGASCPQVTGSFDATTNQIILTLDTSKPLTFTTNGGTTSTVTVPFTVDFNSGPLPDLSKVSAQTQQYAGAFLLFEFTTPAGSYQTGGNYYCRPDIAPVALLKLSPGSGIAPAGGLIETLDGSSSTDASADTIVQYTFTPGDGSPSQTQTASQFSYTYPVGIYKPSLSVQNDRGLSSQDDTTTTLTVSPLPPTNVAASRGSNNSSVNLTWTATASGANANSNIVYNVYYSTTSGGESTPTSASPTNDTTGISGTSTTITGLTPGQTYYFTVYTLGGPGDTLYSTVSNEVSLTLASSNTAPPTASLSATPTSGTSPLTVNFDGSASTTPNPGATLTSYTFNFGDGSASVTQSGATISHSYTKAGGYTATLSVTDSTGQSSSNNAQQNISVSTPSSTSSPPTAALSATPTSGESPLTVNFDGSASTTPNSGATITSYTFNFGDGSASVTQSGATVSHTYSTAGSYTATLIVTDSAGQTSSNKAQQTISATGQPTAALSATPSSGTSPLTVNFDGSASTTPNSGATITSYTFNFGDGSAVVTQSTPTTTHSYTAGDYTATLSVTDSTGAKSGNTALQRIQVAMPATPRRRGTGAAMNVEVLAVIGLAAGLRRRQRRRGKCAAP